MNDHRQLQNALFSKYVLVEEYKATKIAVEMSTAEQRITDYLCTLINCEDIAEILNAERIIINWDLKQYANSPAQTESLNNALSDIATIEEHLAFVKDREKYEIIDRGHAKPWHRRGNLPYDEARKALESYHRMLVNMDKSSLNDADKQTVNMRQNLILRAEYLYIHLQRKILGFPPPKKQNRPTPRSNSTP